ncbi:MAG TPA: hypothetical protein PLY87_27170 [Planctomycetaceae bacterium]|nr:hypothetical protein [Planctomycetaceae bacterium]HQZ68810.1 hypothetical protein [Planctomycetaceae bacterium]
MIGMFEQAFKNIDNVLLKGAGVKAVVLFFENGSPTRSTWYYQLDPGRNLGRTNPLNDDDLAEFIELQAMFADSPKSWATIGKLLFADYVNMEPWATRCRHFRG